MKFMVMEEKRKFEIGDRESVFGEWESCRGM